MKIDSANRSRQKRQAEREEIERQVVANDKRINDLEKEIEALTNELSSGKLPSTSRKDETRPDWFGDPF